MKSLADLQNLLSDGEKKKIADEKEKRDKQMKEAKERISNLTIKEMNILNFPVFIRMNYPELRDQRNDVLYVLGEEFKKYLEDVFKADRKRLEKIWDIEFGSVVMRKMSDPFSVNGYDPVFVIHFGEFCKKMKKEALKLNGKKE